MIQYERGGMHFVLKMFQRRGSVFGTSFRIALPCALLTLALKILSDEEYIPFLNGPKSILTDNGVWSGFSFLVGFLIVFRTSQAYSRFWDGCTSTHLMRAEWYDAASALVAFCRHSKVDTDVIAVFQHTVVRLFSMLHALALAEIEDSNSDNVDEIEAFKYELLDAESIDHDSLRMIRSSDSKVELVYQWIQQLIVENIDTGILSIPAPLLTRVFQEINGGMLQFHEAIKISTIPFPFPYAQTCDCLLLMHYVTTPIVMSQWVSHYVWAFIFSFIQVSILWSLNCIAVEIENPFGQDDNDIDAHSMQEEMNRHLSVLLQASSQRTPRMHNSTIHAIVHENFGTRNKFTRRASFNQVWSNIPVSAAGGGTESQEVARTARRRQSHSTNSSRRSSLSSSWSGSSNARPPRQQSSWGAEASAMAEAAGEAASAASAAAASAAAQARRSSPKAKPRWRPSRVMEGSRPEGDLVPVREDSDPQQAPFRGAEALGAGEAAQAPPDDPASGTGAERASSSSSEAAPRGSGRAAGAATAALGAQRPSAKAQQRAVSKENTTRSLRAASKESHRVRAEYSLDDGAASLYIEVADAAVSRATSFADGKDRA